MKKGGWFERFRDRFLTPWWSRYLVVPAIAALPGVVAGIWFGLHKNSSSPYALQGSEPWVLAAATIWAGSITALKSALNDIAALTVAELVKSRRELIKLIGYVRVIVGFKSRRFHEALQQARSADQTFLEITRPDMQARKIVEAIYSYFSDGGDVASDRVRVSAMTWDAQAGHLRFVEYFPDADAPAANEEAFSDSNTIAGKAFFERDIVVCEDISKDRRFRSFSARDSQGSMFAYPVVDDLSRSVAFVINVVSITPKRFLESDRDAIKIPMEVFGDRLILESRLSKLRERAKAREVEQ